MKRYAAFCLSVMSCLLFACGGGKEEKGSVDLPQIQERGELVALTVNSSTSYFDYRGEPMGFQYELAQQFARSQGLRLRIKVVKDEEALVDSLLAGAGDLIAYNLSLTSHRKDELLYCGEENITYQVIVQRRGKEALKNVTQLIGKEVYVNPGKYVATDEMGRITKTYHPNLDIGLQISFDQRASWAVRNTSPLLAEAADKWHKENINSDEFKVSARRYFELNKRVAHGSILSVENGRISYYDDLFRKYAKEIGWDWRLLAALVYTESNFNPDVVSWAGAKGLMQLMPVTARAMGVPPGKESDPEESIKAGVKYIAALQKMFREVSDKNEQDKFVLAAYNAGAGHVLDAMALARKYGRNPDLWEHHVAHYLLLKSSEKYYQDPVCRNGYLRGTETYNFVKNVMERAAIYKKKIKS